MLLPCPRYVNISDAIITVRLPYLHTITRHSLTYDNHDHMPQLCVCVCVDVSHSPAISMRMLRTTLPLLHKCCGGMRATPLHHTPLHSPHTALPAVIYRYITLLLLLQYLRAIPFQLRKISSDICAHYIPSHRHSATS